MSHRTDRQTYASRSVREVYKLYTLPSGFYTNYRLKFKNPDNPANF